jgi:hypothetical protein
VCARHPATLTSAREALNDQLTTVSSLDLGAGREGIAGLDALSCDEAEAEVAKAYAMPANIIGRAKQALIYRAR